MDDFYKKLTELYRAGDHDKVEEFLLAQTKEQTGINAVPPLNELGSFYRSAGRFKESERCFKDALLALENHGMKKTEQYATILINMATLYQMMGRTDDSMSAFRQAMSGLDPESYVYVSLINNMALTFLRTGNYDRAEELLKEAEQWNDAHHAAAHEVGVTAVNLAAIYIRKEDMDQAKKQVEKAFAAFDSRKSIDVHYAAALSARAAIAAREGRIEDAKADYRQSMQLTEQFFGRNHEYDAAKAALEQLEQLK